MRRPRRNSGPGWISDTWNYSQRSVEDSFGFTRGFTDAINQGMLDEERLEKKHQKEEEQKREEQIYPSCSLSDRPKPL